MRDTKSSPADVQAKLRDAVARLFGPPGDILELRRLTAGATKATWAFKAQVGDANLPLILQLSNGSSRSGDEATLPLVAGRDDATLMIAASEAGVPAPPVRAVLTEDCGLGEGYIMDYVPGVVGDIGQRADLFAAYEHASGMVVDPAHVRFWEGWGCIKWAIICLMKGQSQRSVEAFAIGRRMEEPLYDFLEFVE